MEIRSTIYSTTDNGVNVFSESTGTEEIESLSVASNGSLMGSHIRICRPASDTISYKGFSASANPSTNIRVVAYNMNIPRLGR